MGLITEELPELLGRIPGGAFLVTRMDDVIHWARSNSLWPLTFGTSCCAIETMMATMAAHHDLARFGAEVARPSPRQADLLIVAGTIVRKMAPCLRTLFEQMAEPRYVIATGSCAISGGPFRHHSYSVVRGVEEVIPVDVFVPGCPPRPEALIYGILTLQKRIRDEKRRGLPVTTEAPEGLTMAQLKTELAAASTGGLP